MSPELLSIFREKGFSRLPVTTQSGNANRIAGLVNLRSLIYDEKIDPGRTARDFIKPALLLPEQTRLEIALQRMQRRGHRLAIVMGRHQVEIGIVSLHDILKVIFGEEVLK